MSGHTTQINQAACKTPVPLLDVNRGNEPHLSEILGKIEQICRSGQFIGGPFVAELESRVAELCQTDHAIGCASGSDALLVALMAIGIQPGDEVIVPSFTFFASVSAITRLGAKPVFIDIDPATFNMDVRLLPGLITDRTRAILPVHLFGQCCDMDAIGYIARQCNLHVVEDAAQAIGATFNGRAAGGMGSFGCFSFYPTKNLGGFGDAGMITAGDKELADRARLLSNHGMQPRYYHQAVGINSRLDAIQAAAISTKLPGLALWGAGRLRNATHYNQAFRSIDAEGLIVTPKSDPRCGHVWNQYTIRIPGGRRDDVRAELLERGIGSEIYYPVPMHLQECFGNIEYQPGSLSETEKAACEVLSLPIFPEMTKAELDSVIQNVINCVGGSSSVMKRAA